MRGAASAGRSAPRRAASGGRNALTGRSALRRAAATGRAARSRRDDGGARIGAALLVAAGGGLGLVVVYLLRWWLLAGLVSAVVLGGGAALLVGWCVLVLSYLRRVREVMWTGGHPDEPLPGTRDDPAHLAYHGGPAWWDLRAVVEHSWGAAAPWSVFLLPQFLVHALVVGLYLAAAWTAVGALRLADSGLLLVRRIRMVCPGCFLRLGYPAYLCARCGRRHGAIRPGGRGLRRRECLCGARLPTLLLLGSADLEARCPHCDRGLEHRPGEAREFVLPLFGGTGAGKTRLVTGMNLALAQAARRAPEAYVEPVGEETVRRLREGERVLAAGSRTAPTPPGREVRGLTVRVGASGRTLLMQLFDAAGERFNRSATVEELAYLGRATTFVLAVDPLGIESVWRSLTTRERARLAGDRSHTRDPELAYGAVRDEIRRQYRMLARRRGGRGLRQARLAVVVTRGDLVRGTAIAPGETDPRVWAERTLGLGNLLRDAEADFGEARVFLTSAVTDREGRADPSLNALLRWTLAGEHDAFTAMLAASQEAPGAPRGAGAPEAAGPPGVPEPPGDRGASRELRPAGHGPRHARPERPERTEPDRPEYAEESR
ncbi:TRAFAC clade GTPase domain-containing protein [Nocardiopsis dassonvillei]|uniref:TRAFAC clade GTPase domain-containing protein n=1 Tax=Nocardiopsis dassonvillei TaxID=2014 RepID=UPI003632103E